MIVLLCKICRNERKTYIFKASNMNDDCGCKLDGSMDRLMKLQGPSVCAEATEEIGMMYIQRVALHKLA